MEMFLKDFGAANGFLGLDHLEPVDLLFFSLCHMTARRLSAATGRMFLIDKLVAAFNERRFDQIIGIMGLHILPLTSFLMSLG